MGKKGALSSSDKRELGNDLQVLSEYFAGFKGIQQGETDNWKQKEQDMLLESLRSDMLSHPPPGHKVYKDSFFFRNEEIAEAFVMFSGNKEYGYTDADMIR